MTISLLLDCGNTMIKAAFWTGSKLIAPERLAPRHDALSAYVATHTTETHWARTIVLPTGKTVAIAQEWLDHQTRIDQPRALNIIGTSQSLPSVNAYPGFGLDRLAAGFAAISVTSQPTVVVDCGTATTFTAWEIEHHHSKIFPKLLGGMILPSAQTCIDGLIANAPALPRVQPFPHEVSAVQRTTVDAIAAAISIGYPGMIDRCLRKIMVDSGCEKLVVTGGAAPMYLPSLAVPYVYEPWLVLLGMVLIDELTNRV